MQLSKVRPAYSKYRWHSTTATHSPTLWGSEKLRSGVLTLLPLAMGKQVPGTWKGRWATRATKYTGHVGHTNAAPRHTHTCIHTCMHPLPNLYLSGHSRAFREDLLPRPHFQDKGCKNNKAGSCNVLTQGPTRKGSMDLWRSYPSGTAPPLSTGALRSKPLANEVAGGVGGLGVWPWGVGIGGRLHPRYTIRPTPLPLSLKMTLRVQEFIYTTFCH